MKGFRSWFVFVLAIASWMVFVILAIGYVVINVGDISIGPYQVIQNGGTIRFSLEEEVGFYSAGPFSIIDTFDSKPKDIAEGPNEFGLYQVSVQKFDQGTNILIISGTNPVTIYSQTQAKGLQSEHRVFQPLHIRIWVALQVLFVAVIVTFIGWEDLR